MEAYTHEAIEVLPIPSIAFTSFARAVKSLFLIPLIVWQILKGMRRAEHIHLRCPGNIGLLGVLMQFWFPKKKKTAKYAGNWDPEAKQPLSYRIQKILLASPFFSRNMTVLVYGDWPGQSSNVCSFFTATYTENQKPEGLARKTFKEPYQALFVGSLSVGKRPMYAVNLIQSLRESGINIFLKLYGTGAEVSSLANYITSHKLDAYITLEGVATAEEMIAIYKKSDLLLLPSKSEGWPKVVAEAMFWGVVPVVTPVSCVPWMLESGDRGLLLSLELEKDTRAIRTQLLSSSDFIEKSEKAQLWSRAYTLDTFEASIKELLL